MTETLNVRSVESEKTMHPKTFHVMIRHPFGLRFSMYVHNDTWQTVLGWVESTFPGVDTRPTVSRKNVASGSPPSIGNSDPVVIHDVDMYSTTSSRVGGKIVRSKLPEGHWRRSAEDVINDLYRAATFLREQSIYLTRSFQGLRHQYERGSTQTGAYDRLLEMKATIELADVWQDNIWQQYCAARPQRDLEMPEHRIAAIVESA
jgi:hypothetical protein